MKYSEYVNSGERSAKVSVNFRIGLEAYRKLQDAARRQEATMTSLLEWLIMDADLDPASNPIPHGPRKLSEFDRVSMVVELRKKGWAISKGPKGWQAVSGDTKTRWLKRKEDCVLHAWHREFITDQSAEYISGKFSNDGEE